jgi:acyl carrier protein
MDEFLGSVEFTSRPRSQSPGTLDRIHKVFAESIPVSAGEEDLPHELKLDVAASLDSIAVLEFMTAVEQEFGIELEPEFLEFDFLRDLPALAAYLEDRMKGQPDSET